VAGPKRKRGPGWSQKGPSHGQTKKKKELGPASPKEKWSDPRRNRSCQPQRSGFWLAQKAIGPRLDLKRIGYCHPK